MAKRPRQMIADRRTIAIMSRSRAFVVVRILAGAAIGFALGWLARDLANLGVVKWAREWQTLLAALVALGGALGAAAIAWRSVHMQIGVDRVARMRRQGALADAISFELGILVRDLRMDPFGFHVDRLEQIVRDSRVEATEIDPRLGAALRTALEDLVEFRSSMDRAGLTATASAVVDPASVLWTHGRQAAFRLRLLEHAFAKAHSVLLSGEAAQFEFIGADVLSSYMAEFEAVENDVGWARLLIDEQSA